MQVSFYFEKQKPELNEAIRCGFDLGFFSISGNQGKFDSESLQMPCKIYVYITIIDVLDSLRRLITSKKNMVEAIVAGSSIRIKFEKINSHLFSLSINKNLIEISPLMDMVRDFIFCVEQFLNNENNRLLDSDSVFDDLNSALVQLRKTAAR